MKITGQGPGEPPRRIRREIVGNTVKLPTGEVGKVTGINSLGIARVVIEATTFRDVDQDTLVLVKESK